MFLKIKPSNILIKLKQIGETHLSHLARESNVTFPYINKTIRIFEAKGFVNINKRGKYTVVKLTETGLNLAKLLEEVSHFEQI